MNNTINSTITSCIYLYLLTPSSVKHLVTSCPTPFNPITSTVNCLNFFIELKPIAPKKNTLVGVRVSVDNRYLFVWNTSARTHFWLLVETPFCKQGCHSVP